MPESAQPTFEEWLETDYIPIAGGSPEADGAGAEGADADGAEPLEGDGQDGEAQSWGLYDLASVPEDLREHVEPHLKAIDANVTRKFQEYADQVKGWEPYQEMGLNEVDPEAIGQLLQFAEMTQDPDAFQQWWQQVGEQQGWMDQVTGDDEFDLGDEGDLSPDRVRELVEEAVQERLNPVEQSLEQQQQQQLEQEIHGEVIEQLNGLKAEHGDDIDTEAILQLAYAYTDDENESDPIARGFEDYQRLVGKGEANLFGKKSRQPAPAEGPGSAATTPEKITSFDQASGAALERLKQANAT